MATSSPIAALVQAAATAAGGLIAHAVWGEPGLTIAAAALAAGGAALLARRGDDVPAPPAAPAATPPRDRPELPVRDMIDALPVGLMLVAPDRTVRLINGRLEQMLGRTGLAGSHVSLIRSARLLDAVEAALTDRTPGTLEITHSRAGDASLRAHIRPLDDGSVLVAVEDETQRRRAEEMHRDFVANASHELKTPLAASSGIIETLLGHARDDPEAMERFLGLLQKQTVRMTRLINDLMSLNRIEIDARVLPDEPQNLAAILSETVEILTPVAEAAGVALDLSLPEQAAVTGDHDQLAQLFANLIDNAIKYAGAGTTVRIFPVAPAEGRAQIGIAVQDQGIGIAREHLPRLTERFYRVNVRRSREVGGTGLGLAIVKHILNRHKGRLEIESTPGEGSRFTAWLPLRA